MKPYWIKAHGRTAPYALIITPWEAQPGPRQPLCYDSREELFDELSGIGIKDAEIRKAEKGLDKDGEYIIDGQVLLSDEQVTRLGFALAA